MRREPLVKKGIVDISERGIIITLAIFFLTTLLPSFLLSSEKIKVKDLPPRYQKWLGEEVIYIITPREKETYLLFKSDRERDIFIEAFWKQRDPTPGTAENEFKTEHFRRIAYANKFFSRETTRPGWMTDRGRIYIILGPPVDIDRFESTLITYPSEVWFYTGKKEPALPPAFNIVFFKKRGMGEYILYSPVHDGPSSLLSSYAGSHIDLQTAYKQLKAHEPDLAEYALTLIPGERPLPGHPSLFSDILLSNIKTLPQKKVEDSYVQALLKYKDIIEVEYTANYIQSNALVKVFQDDSGLFFVHYSIEPKRLSVDSFEDKYFANFLLIGNFSDFEGKIIFQYEKNFSLEFSQEQLRDIEGKSFALQDIIPLIPGNYKFSLLIKNTTSKEFSSYEQDITVPQILDELQMSALLLCYRSEKKPEDSSSLKPFKLGQFQLIVQPRTIFSVSDQLIVFFQIYGLSTELRKNGQLEYTFTRNSTFLLTKDFPLINYPPDLNFKEEFALSDFSPGFYTLKISLFDNQKKELLTESIDFELSSISRLPRPWIFVKALPSSENVEYNYILGNQYFNQGNFLQAEKLLSTAFHRNPASLKYAAVYSLFLFQQKKFEKVRNTLLPFTKEAKVKDFSFLLLLGKSLQALKEYESAILHYKNYLAHKGTNLMVLNAIGECYSLLGNKKEALVAWEKSLEIDPKQEEIQEKVRALKRKK